MIMMALRMIMVIPASIEENRLVSGFSDGILAPAEKTHHHFELLAEVICQMDLLIYPSLFDIERSNAC